MKPRFQPLPVFVSVLLFLFILPLGAQHWSLEDTLVLTDVNVVDVRSGEVHSDQVVIIVKNRITTVGPRKPTRYPRNTPTINGRGAYLIPGLWDMHVHLVFGYRVGLRGPTVVIRFFTIMTT